MTDPEPGVDPQPDSVEAAEPPEKPFPQTEQTEIPFTEKDAEQDTINSQIDDELAETKAAVAVGAVVVADASLAQVIAQAAGLAMLNAVNAQQNAYVTANATLLTTVSRILGARGVVVEETGGEAKPNG